MFSNWKKSGLGGQMVVPSKIRHSQWPCITIKNRGQSLANYIFWRGLTSVCTSDYHVKSRVALFWSIVNWYFSPVLYPPETGNSLQRLIFLFGPPWELCNTATCCFYRTIGRYCWLYCKKNRKGEYTALLIHTSSWFLFTNMNKLSSTMHFWDPLSLALNIPCITKMSRN